jgi:hypothetical protein
MVAEVFLGCQDLTVFFPFHELDDQNFISVTDRPQGLTDGRSRLSFAVAGIDEDQPPAESGQRFRDGIFHNRFS